MDSEKLNQDQIADALAKVEGWEIQDDFITKEYEFDDFQTALAFVNTVGEIAETTDHHPDIMFGWGYAEIAITSHEAGGLTAQDFDLAAKIDNL
jgi:4a-hydroxytetrahydrobiopterin dehydratase